MGIPIRSSLFLATLVLGLLLLPGAATGEKIQRFTDEQGTSHIETVSPATPEKADEAKEPSGRIGPEGLAPRNINPRDRRDYFGQASTSRHQAVMEELQLFRPNRPAPVSVPPSD